MLYVFGIVDMNHTPGQSTSQVLLLASSVLPIAQMTPGALHLMRYR